MPSVRNGFRRLKSAFLPQDREAYEINGWFHGRLSRRPVTEVFEGIGSVDVDLTRPFDLVRQTSVSYKELMILCAVVKLRQAKTILEIGTFDGRTTLNMALNSPEGSKLYTVDLPTDWSAAHYPDGMSQGHRNASDPSVVGTWFRSHPLGERITQVYADSMKLDFGMFDSPFDLVFIDGCHQYDYVVSDSANAVRSLAPGGVIVWHDYGLIRDVSVAVDEWSDRMHLSAIEGTRLAVGFPRSEVL